eukprot:7260407-Prorocentrum_lima.AAC.1
MEVDTNVAQLFQYGGYVGYPDGPLDGSGIVHILHRLGRYFKEHEQEEILRISAEYAAFSR